MASQYKPFDISHFCRVYLRFISMTGQQVNTYYERPQHLSDEEITSEALVNAEDMKKRFHLRDLISIYIGRTATDVAFYESQPNPQN